MIQALHRFYSENLPLQQNVEEVTKETTSTCLNTPYQYQHQILHKSSHN